MKRASSTRQGGSSTAKPFDFGAVQPQDVMEVHTNVRTWKLSPTDKSVLSEDTVTGVSITIDGYPYRSPQPPDETFVNRFYEPGGILSILGDETDEVVTGLTHNGEPVEFRH